MASKSSGSSTPYRTSIEAEREREREGFRCPTKSTEPGKRLAAVDSEIKACCTEGPTELTTPQNLIQSVVGLVQDISLL